MKGKIMEHVRDTQSLPRYSNLSADFQQAYFDWLGLPTEDACSGCGKSPLKRFESLNGRCESCRLGDLERIERKSKGRDPVLLAGIAEAYRHYDRDGWVRRFGEIPEALLEWQSQILTFLPIHGPTGTGKTGLSVVAIRELAQDGASGVWVDVREAVDTIREQRIHQGHSRLEEKLRKAGYLAMDDLGKERWTDHTRDFVTGILRARHLAGRSTLITTQVSPAEWVKLDPALARRMFDDGSIELA